MPLDLAGHLATLGRPLAPSRPGHARWAALRLSTRLAGSMINVAPVHPLSQMQDRALAPSETFRRFPKAIG
jgi:hypothetical protein